MRYPAARREPVVEELHGRRVPDPYRWLEDPASAETRRWLAEQEDLWRCHAAGLPDRDELHAAVAELSRTGMVAAPLWRGRRRFHVRQDPDREHPVLYTATRNDAEEVLLDPMALDASGLTVLDAWQPDLEGQRLAYQVSRRGQERSELYVLNVLTRRVLDGPIDRCRYSPVAWLPGGTAFYYVRAGAGADTVRRVFLHKVGTPAEDDTPVFSTGDSSVPGSYGLAMSQDGRWLTLSARRGQGNDVWLADLAGCAPEEPAFRPAHTGVDGVQTALNVGPDGRLYALTTYGAPRGRVCVGDPAAPAIGAWRELVGEDPTAVIGDVTVLHERGLLLVRRTRHAAGEIGVHDLSTGTWLRDVPLPGVGSVGSLTTDGRHAWFSYTDSVTPRSVYRFDGRRSTAWAVPPGAATGVARTTRLTCTSADGTTIRMAVLSPPDPGPRSRRPAIVYGYGGFGIPMTPSYSAYALAWVRAGGIFVTVNLRGGGEEGERWHEAGRGPNKQNAVDDLVAAASKLIADGWTDPGKLAACGESNGGLVVAAAITQRPELFAAAVCSAPLTDMVRYERLGLGATWRAEYGSATDPEQLGWLLAYSPYHRALSDQPAPWPAVLLTASDGDTRVDPMHARKLCAALQAGAGERPVLLRMEAGTGHGAKAASRAIALAGDLLAFLAAQTGLATGLPSTGRGQIQPAS